MLADLLREQLELRGDGVRRESRLHALGFERDPAALSDEQALRADAEHPDGEQPSTDSFDELSRTEPEPAYRFKLARIVSREEQPSRDSERELKGFDALSDEELRAKQPSAGMPELLNLNALIRVMESLAVPRASKHIDTRRLCQRIARQRALTPLPLRHLRSQQPIDWVLFGHCPELLGDQLALCALMARLPDTLRPGAVARLDGNGLLLDEQGRSLHPRAVPGGRLFIVADPHVADAALTQARNLLAPEGEHHWLSPVPHVQANRWDLRPARPAVGQGVALMRALLAPLPVIEKTLLRRLRRQLGLHTGAEIEFWQHRGAYYNPQQEWGQIDPAQRAHFLQRLTDFCSEQSKLVSECLALINDHMRQREPLYFAEASLSFRQLPLAWRHEQQGEFQQLDDFLARMAVRGRDGGHSEASASLLGMADRLPSDIALSEPVASAVDLAQRTWAECFPDQPALVGQRPAQGLAGKAETAYLGFDGQAFTVSRNHLVGQLASLRCTDKGVVIDRDRQRQVQALEQPFVADAFQVHGVDSLFNITTLDSDNLWWAEAITQGPGGLHLEVSGHHITLDLPEALHVLWPGTACPAIDSTGLYVDVDISGVTQRFRYIPPGRFDMGSSENEAERGGDELWHEVIISNGYWLADTACTQELWQAMTGDNPSRFSDDVQNPVEKVSWDNVSEAIEGVNHQDGLGFELPTEAQWEYACRAGTDSAFCWGDSLSPQLANYDGNHPYSDGEKGEFRERTVPVRSFDASPWGLYQMHGNVWEWCADWYGEYAAERTRDPAGPGAGELRVLRGGCWNGSGRFLRSAQRFNFSLPVNRNYFIGFRLSHPVPEPEGNTVAEGSHAAEKRVRERPLGSARRSSSEVKTSQAKSTP